MTAARRPPATGLDDATVERIVLAVIQRLGYFDLGLACYLIGLEQRRRRGRHLWLVEREPWPPASATSCCPSGAA